jgi:hypothetical protein
MYIRATSLSRGKARPLARVTPMARQSPSVALISSQTWL